VSAKPRQPIIGSPVWEDGRTWDRGRQEGAKDLQIRAGKPGWMMIQAGVCRDADEDEQDEPCHQRRPLRKNGAAATQA